MSSNQDLSTETKRALRRFIRKKTPVPELNAYGFTLAHRTLVIIHIPTMPKAIFGSHAPAQGGSQPTVASQTQISRRM